MTESSGSCRALVELKNKHGLHARPAHLFVQTANAYASKVSVWREDGGDRVDGKSIMGMMMLAAECGSAIGIEAEGPDADAMLRALVELVEAGFGEE
jgi:phosphocarrier protein HPr